MESIIVLAAKQVEELRLSKSELPSTARVSSLATACDSVSEALMLSSSFYSRFGFTDLSDTLCLPFRLGSDREDETIAD